MIFGIFSLLYAVLALIAVSLFLWGIGSAMMNGIRYSSLGRCLLTALISAGLAAACLQVATILMDAK